MVARASAVSVAAGSTGVDVDLSIRASVRISGGSVPGGSVPGRGGDGGGVLLLRQNDDRQIGCIPVHPTPNVVVLYEQNVKEPLRVVDDSLAALLLKLALVVVTIGRHFRLEVTVVMVVVLVAAAVGLEERARALLPSLRAILWTLPQAYLSGVPCDVGYDGR